MTTYSVTFVLNHAAVTVSVAVDGYLEDDLIAEAAAELLAADGLDLANATVQDFTVEVA